LIEDSELEFSVVILRNHLKTRCPARLVPSPLGRRAPAMGARLKGNGATLFEAFEQYFLHGGFPLTPALSRGEGVLG